MSGEMTEVMEGGKVSEWLARPQLVERFDHLLEGTGYGGEDFIARILVALNRPDLLDCTVKSQFEAAHKCAVMGLFPDLQHVALVPKNINVGTKDRPRWEKQVTVIPQWQGLQALMHRDPQVLEVTPYLVHVNDGFSITDGAVEHVYNPLDPNRKIEKVADLQGGYAVVTYRDGRPKKYHFVTAHYIDKCRQCAETQNVWNKWFEAQALKTVLRSAWSRRVINFDPILQKRLVAVGLTDDESLGNQPLRGLVVEQRPTGLPSSTPAKRGNMILDRMTHKSEQRQEGEPAPSKGKKTPARQEAPAEEITGGDDGSHSAGEATNNDAGEPQGEQQTAAPPDEADASKAYKEFLTMFKAEKTVGGLKRLMDFIKKPTCSVKLTSEEREAAILLLDEAITLSPKE